jgi:CspA family cold shock protein
MQDQSSDAEIIRGCVKWFDPGKGFGFIVSDEGGPDILLHANVLRNFGQSSVADGSEIVVEVQTTPRGRQALAVMQITPPDTPSTSGLADLAGLDPEDIASAPVQPSRVKWFDKAKGFGFANIFGLEEDVFVHIEVLRRSGFADLQPGEAVGLRVIEGKRGKMATEVVSWDAATDLPREL